MELTKKEIEVIITMINCEQFDEAEWTTNGIKLNDLKRKLENAKMALEHGNKKVG